eukprot:GHVT01100855.1.p1 GENE.GHVT01100855.1~~GHVT01100855.1.p1  ORF type:complete len:118 (-),score=29.62 GHVT01100855.1:30-383(-)
MVASRSSFFLSNSSGPLAVAGASSSSTSSSRSSLLSSDHPSPPPPQHSEAAADCPPLKVQGRLGSTMLQQATHSPGTGAHSRPLQQVGRNDKGDYSYKPNAGIKRCALYAIMQKQML